MAGRAVQVHDDGEQIRCFAHVDDVVGAVIGLTDHPETGGEIFNIGSDQPVSILELAQRVLARTQSSSAIEFQSYHEAYDKDFEDIRRRIPDLSKITRVLGYEPKFSLDEIIDDVAAQQRGA